jgi:hypothetical protein
MATMGKYCKAYPIQRLRDYSGWVENTANTRKEKTQIDDKEMEAPRVLTENDFLYVQENYVVTDGIFKDENIVFDAVTPEWIAYCQQSLKFEIPVYEPVNPAEDNA